MQNSSLETIKAMEIPFIDHTGNLLNAAFKSFVPSNLITGKGADELFLEGKDMKFNEKIANECSFLNRLYNNNNMEFCNPFLEGTLIDLGLNLPLESKQGPIDKLILRKAFGPLLPQKIALKPRQGSSVPQEWALPQNYKELIDKTTPIMQTIPSIIYKKAEEITELQLKLTVLALWEKEHLQKWN